MFLKGMRQKSVVVDGILQNIAVILPYDTVCQAPEEQDQQQTVEQIHRVGEEPLLHKNPGSVKSFALHILLPEVDFLSLLQLFAICTHNSFRLKCKQYKKRVGNAMNAIPTRMPR